MFLCAATFVVLTALPHEDAFLAARDLESLNNPAAAAQAYATVGETDSPLAAFARIRTATNLLQTNRADEGLTLLRRVADAAGDSPEGWLARVRLAEALAARNQVDEAALLYTSLLELSYRPWWLHRYAWNAAQTVRQSATLRPLAYAYFREFVETSESPSDRLNAAALLAQSDAAIDRLTAAAAYLRAGQTAQAAPLVAGAALDAANDPALHARLRDLSAWLLMGTGEGEPGRAALRQAAQDHAASAWVRPALLYAVRNLAGQGRLEDAEAAAGVLADLFPGAEETGSAWWTLGRAYAVRDRTADAHRAYSRLAEAAPRHMRANEALLVIAMDHLQNGRPAAARQRFEQIRRANPDGRFASTANYWLGRLAQEGGDAGAARGYFETALTTTLGDFYAHRARARLRALDPEAADGIALDAGVAGGLLHTLPAPPPPALGAELPSGQAAQLEKLHFLASHGLEEAEWIGLYLLNQPEAPPPYLYWDLMRAGLVETAHGHARRRLPAAVPEAEALRARLDFPVAFWPLVKQAHEETGVDPYLMLAVALRESTFRAWVRSSAGAQGLMQVMPATADWLTRVEPALAPETARQLDRPLSSLRLGAHYLSRMVSRSDGNLVYALASYNAGPGNVDKWRRRFGEIDTDEFIERIPFAETRNYVKSVLGAWAAYRSLYPDLDDHAALRPAEPVSTAVLVPKTGE